MPPAAITIFPLSLPCRHYAAIAAELIFAISPPADIETAMRLARH
jgi:hypothetical protein